MTDGCQSVLVEFPTSCTIVFTFEWHEWMRNAVTIGICGHEEGLFWVSSFPSFTNTSREVQKRTDSGIS